MRPRVVDWVVALKIDVHIPESAGTALSGKRVFAHVTKDLKTRSSWIIGVGPTHVQCPCKRLRRDRWEEAPEDRGRDWMMHPHTQE